MKKTVFFVFVLFAVRAFTQNPGDSVFAGIKIYTIKLQFNQPNYWDSLTYYYNQGAEQYMLAKVTINGIEIDSVGARFKGNASFSHPNNKKPFKIGFGEYREAQKWDGLKSIHLNNGWGDPTFIREKLHLDFCRDLGIPAPRANYAVLFINDQLWGFYSMVESVDKRFLANHYPENAGNLYKAVDAFGATQYFSDFVWYGTDSNDYKPRYELKTDEPVGAWTDLIRMIDSLNNSASLASGFPPVFESSSFLRAVAADNIFGNLDSYIGSGRNFYVYNNPATHKFTWIVWDAGLSLGAYPQGPSNVENLSLTYTINAAQRPLAAKLFAAQPFRNDYLRAVCRFTSDNFVQSKLYLKIDSIANVIRPFVYSDTKKMYTTAQFEMNISSDITPTGSSRIPGLKAFINARRNSILSQLTALGVTCNISVFPGELVINEFMAANDTLPDPAGEFEDWIELYNTSSRAIDLSGMYLSDDYASPMKWQFPANTTLAPNSYLIIWADEDSGQAGLHASFKLAAAGEKIILSNTDGSLLDSVSFSAQVTNRSMARVPNGTGKFYQGLPTIAAANGSSVVLAKGAVVINEFMADNKTIPDPAGEFDDWIEFYNTTDQTVSLSGLLLSDNFASPAKWRFPDNTSIGPKSFLVVWADEDSGQAGVHASFKLSASGERILFSNENLSVIDSVTFGPQSANLTMARVPNGTGPFVVSNPTIGTSNTGVSVREARAENERSFSLSQNYPNPFNPVTSITFSVNTTAHASLTVYDILGRAVERVFDGIAQPGAAYSVLFDAKGLPSGIYFCVLESGAKKLHKAMILMK